MNTGSERKAKKTKLLDTIMGLLSKSKGDGNFPYVHFFSSDLVKFLTLFTPILRCIGELSLVATHTHLKRATEPRFYVQKQRSTGTCVRNRVNNSLLPNGGLKRMWILY